MAVRYCDSTIRRSNSNQRGSLLPDKSIAPPVCQKEFQLLCEIERRDLKLGILILGEVGEKAQKNSKQLVFDDGKIMNWCFATFVNVAAAFSSLHQIGRASCRERG